MSMSGSDGWICKLFGLQARVWGTRLTVGAGIATNALWDEHMNSGTLFIAGLGMLAIGIGMNLFGVPHGSLVAGSGCLVMVAAGLWHRRGG